MCRPVFQQRFRPSPGGVIQEGSALETALKWWKSILSNEIHEFVQCFPDQRKCIDLFCDAASTPPWVGAVLVVDGRVLYTDCGLGQDWMDFVPKRKGGDIMAWELVSIVLGLHTFASHLRGRSVRVWTDNTAGEGALHKGGCKAADMNLLVHHIWMWAFKEKTALWIDRVPTKDNVADGPSRGWYKALRALYGKWVDPILPSGASIVM